MPWPVNIEFSPIHAFDVSVATLKRSVPNLTTAVTEKAARAALPILDNDDEIFVAAELACESTFFNCELNLSLFKIRLKSISPTLVLIYLTYLLLPYLRTSL